jgi:hypothetical protein
VSSFWFCATRHAWSGWRISVTNPGNSRWTFHRMPAPDDLVADEGEIVTAE